MSKIYLPGSNVTIGYTPEHNARAFSFDISTYQMKWSDAEPRMLVQRPGEDVPYIAETTLDEGVMTWTVTRYDTEKPGVGKMWVAFVGADDSMLGLTPPSTVRVLGGPEMVDGDTPVELLPPWMQQVVEMVDSIPDKVDEAIANMDVSAKCLTNYLHNADFTQWVAQAGIAAVHAGGSVTFGGDRWGLTGTLTAEANTNGNGYKNVTLNGTLKQKVEMPPANGYVGVSVLSGEAEISYADGVVTITGSDCVLDQAWLYDEESNKPPVRRGYSAELMDCYRYYIYFPQSGQLSYGGFAQSSTEARFTMPLPVPMRLENPTNRIRYRTTLQMYPGAVTPEAINGVTVIGNTASISLKSSGLTAGAVMVLKTNAIIELCADL